MYEPVIAHYYVDPKYDPLSRIRTRVGAELHTLRRPGDLVIINPGMMKMNLSNLGPGVYQIIEVRPNNKYPEVHYDYSKYGGWTEALEPTGMIIVKPIFQINKDKFNNYEFVTTTKVNAKGELINYLIIIDSNGHLVEEREL